MLILRSGVSCIRGLEDLPTFQQTYIDSKLTPDTSLEDVHGWVDRIWRDPGNQGSFAAVTLKVPTALFLGMHARLTCNEQRFTSLTSALDVESLSHLCKILYSYDAALDIMSLHVKISDLIFQALHFLKEYDCETVGA